MTEIQDLIKLMFQYHPIWHFHGLRWIFYFLSWTKTCLSCCDNIIHFFLAEQILAHNSSRLKDAFMHLLQMGTRQLRIKRKRDNRQTMKSFDQHRSSKITNDGARLVTNFFAFLRFSEYIWKRWHLKKITQKED